MTSLLNSLFNLLHENALLVLSSKFLFLFSFFVPVFLMALVVVIILVIIVHGITILSWLMRLYWNTLSILS